MLFKYEVFKLFILFYISSELNDFWQHARARARVLCRAHMADSAAQTGIGHRI